MESKQIIALLAIVAVASAACIGAAYAFSASLDNEDNSVGVQYWELTVLESSNGATSISDPEGKLYTGAFVQPIPFDTKTVYEQRTGDIAPKQYIIVKDLVGGIDLIDFDDKTVTDAGIAQLGWLKFHVQDKDGNDVTNPAGKYYPFTISVPKGNYNENYDLYAAVVTSTSNDQIKISEMALFTAKTDTYEVTLCTAADTVDFTIALFAMPSDLSDLSKLKKDSFKETAGYSKTDVLQDADFAFSMSSTEADIPAITTIAVQSEPTKLAYHGFPASITDDDKSGLVVVATYDDDTKRVVGWNSLTFTAPEAPTADPTEVPVFKIGIALTSDNTISTEQVVDIYYTVTFDAMNNTDVTTVDVSYWDVVAQPADPTYGAKVFVGWFIDPTGTDPAYVFSTPVTADLTLKAKWTDA